MQKFVRRNVMLVPRAINYNHAYRSFYTETPTVAQLMQESPSLLTAVKKMSKEVGAQFSTGFKQLYRNVMRKRGELKQKVEKKEELSRADLKFMQNTTDDLLCLIPFGAFSMLPASTALLPVFIKLAPFLLPSTFHTAQVKAQNLARSQKITLLTTGELQDQLISTLAPLLRTTQNKSLEKLNKGLRIDNKNELEELSSLCKAELSLENLSRGTLVALCRYFGLFALGLPSSVLRKRLTTWALKISLDDWKLKKEGLDALSADEIHLACVERRIYFKLSRDDTESEKKALALWLNTLPVLSLSPLHSSAPKYMIEKADEEQGAKNRKDAVALYIWGAFLLQPKNN